MKKLALCCLLGFVLTMITACSSTAPPLIEAIQSNDNARSTSLIASGININETDSNGGTALYWATHFLNVAMVRDLLAANADPNITTPRNSAALEIAICRSPQTPETIKEQMEIVTMLLDAGAEVNIQSNDRGSSPLMLAAHYRNTAAALAILKKGANTDLKNNAGQTALMTAAKTGNIPLVKALLAVDADVNIATPAGLLPGVTPGITALMVAARAGHFEITNAMLAAGANVNATAPAGFTALFSAASHGRENIVRLLLKAGADTNIRVQAGPSGYTTALKAAQNKGYTTITELLKAAGAVE
jgi:serine/threonine-protein phosphatase 6 regulatory ankyrin repeat subunit B